MCPHCLGKKGTPKKPSWWSVPVYHPTPGSGASHGASHCRPFWAAWAPSTDRSKRTIGLGLAFARMANVPGKRGPQKGAAKGWSSVLGRLLSGQKSIRNICCWKVEERSVPWSALRGLTGGLFSDWWLLDWREASCRGASWKSQVLNLPRWNSLSPQMTFALYHITLVFQHEHLQTGLFGTSVE